MNQTKIQVPRIAVAKAKIALLHRVEAGINSRASRMPNCAEGKMVAPVVATQICYCTAALHDEPRHAHANAGTKMASRRGTEMMKISSCSKLPARKLARRQIDHTYKQRRQDKTSNGAKRTMVERYGLIQSSLFSIRLAMANCIEKLSADGDWTYHASSCVLQHSNI